VPGDSTANGRTDPKVAAPGEDSSDARLARLFFPGPTVVGLRVNPRRTARGRRASHRHAHSHRLPRPAASAFRP
jgi:hypothetical protein